MRRNHKLDIHVNSDNDITASILITITAFGSLQILFGITQFIIVLLQY